MPVLRVDPDFAVRNHAALVRVHVLDGVFNRDDVTARVLVAMADHGRQRCRLTRAGTTDDDDEPALVHDHILEDGRQVEIFEGRDRSGDRSNDSADIALLNERADTIAPDTLRRDGEVALTRRVEFPRLFVVHDRAHENRALFWLQDRVAGSVNFSIDLDCWWKASGDKKVRTTFLVHLPEQVLHQGCGLFSIHLGLLPVLA